MKGFIKFILFFTPYVNLFEWKVDRFFKSVKSSDSIYSIKADLLSLMRQNLIVVNVWMEKKYKGYRYLSKRTRRKMYEDSGKIVERFNEELLIHGPASVSDSVSRDEKTIFLASIMRFLMPGKYYKYISTASFGKLLRDPKKELLEGDCNQIVTLYAYLYSTKYPIDDLEIKLLPEHVCLHYSGIDIEATNATFQKYTNYTHILPITEIISTNMLDLADFREETSKVSPRIFVKSAQLAYAISSLKEIVDKNLQVAYQNLAIEAMNHGNFESALFFSSKMRDKSLYGKIRFNKAIDLYKKEYFEKALILFREIGDEKMQKACYSQMYNKLAESLKWVKTTTQLKQNRRKFEKLLDLARKVGDDKLVSNVEKMLRS